MSGNDGSKSRDTSKTPTATIKLAAKEASQRAAPGTADPGPGDISAAPSVAPTLVDIPSAPTPSQLVVKTVSTGKTGFQTIKDSKSGSAKKDLDTTGSSSSKNSGASSDKVSSIASQMSGAGAPKESTSSKNLQAPPSQSGQKTASEAGLPPAGSTRPLSVAGNTTGGNDGRSVSSPGTTGGSKSAPKASTVAEGGSDQTVSTAMQADSGNVIHDDEEVGEGEVENPDESPKPTPSPSPAVSGATGQSRSPGKKASDVDGPTSTGPSKAGVKTGRGSRSPLSSDLKLPVSARGKGPKKKVTKFRYHKRITVRTTGKTSPNKIMDKVNQKDHKVGITPSSIGEMDPQELMKRAGIKGTDKTHWRVRLRQTKRLTKDGKTVTQTKIAYRDSEGNKRIKTTTNPNCKNCGEKLENCKCEDRTQDE